jgi:hypothetical protein
MRRSLAAAGLMVVVGLLAFGSSAFANGPPVVKQTDQLVNEESTQVDVHPCTGVPVQLTLVETGMIHFSAFADGTVHFTGTLRGTFSADNLPADGVPDATGTFTTWFGGNGLLLEEGGAIGKAQSAFTLNGRGTNADGSTFRFHQNGNTVFDQDGVPKLDFANSRCR